MVEILKLNFVTDGAVSDLATLASALHEDSRSTDTTALKEMIADPNIALVVAKDGERIVGMGALYTIKKIGKSNAYIEDVIVSTDYRGQGLGEKIVQELIACAKNKGISSISLTSSAHRVAAHKLYEKLGFTIKDTNVFKLKL